MVYIGVILTLMALPEYHTPLLKALPYVTEIILSRPGLNKTNITLVRTRKCFYFMFWIIVNALKFYEYIKQSNWWPDRSRILYIYTSGSIHACLMAQGGKTKWVDTHCHFTLCVKSNHDITIVSSSWIDQTWQNRNYFCSFQFINDLRI